MGLFDLFSDVVDSIDKSRQAREYTQRAKELVREGEDIYEKTYEKVTLYALETQYLLLQHIEYKMEVAKELGSNIGATLRDFDDFNIDAKIMTAPSIQEPSAGLRGFESAALNIMPRVPHLDLPSIFEMFSSDDDYYEARRQRDEARYYKEQMKRERDKLNEYKRKMSELRTFIAAEKREIDSLMNKIKKMMGELKTSMQKSNFSIEEAKKLKGLHAIAECIIVSLSTEFLRDGLSINQKYQEAFESVKSINQNLPYAPSISDESTADAIKRILDGTIFY